MVAATGNDQLLSVVVSGHKPPLADVLAMSLSGPDLVAERILAGGGGLLLAFLVLVDADRVQAGLELASRLVVGEVAVWSRAVGSVAAHRHSGTTN